MSSGEQVLAFLEVRGTFAEKVPLLIVITAQHKSRSNPADAELSTVMSCDSEKSDPNQRLSPFVNGFG